MKLFRKCNEKIIKLYLKSENIFSIENSQIKRVLINITKEI